MQERHPARLLKLENLQQTVIRVFMCYMGGQIEAAKASWSVWVSTLETVKRKSWSTSRPNSLHACRVSDAIAALERAAAKEPLTVRGSAGQKVIQPLISEIRSSVGYWRNCWRG